MSKKKYTTVHVREHGSFYDLDGPLTGAIDLLSKYLGEIPEEYRAEAMCEIRYDRCNIYYHRPETEEEMRAREAIEKARSNKVAAEERALLAKLKAKYEGGNQRRDN